MPLRKSARKPRKSNPPAGFVNVEEALQELEGTVQGLEDDQQTKYEDGEDLISDDEVTGHRKKRVRLTTRPQRSPSPSVRLTPIPPSPLPGSSSLAAASSPSGSTIDSAVNSINVNIHVPPNCTGPLVVQLKLQDLLHAQPGSNVVISPVAASPKTAVAQPTGRVGFLDLPPELRNQCYRLIFVSPTVVSFNSGGNLPRSSALLATCSLINKEGCEILYGENEFLLSRQTRERGQFFQPKWMEVGYKDCLRFLTAIGPLNISRLRKIELQLYDAFPGTTPHLDHEERRFVNDEVLIKVLRLLWKHASLQQLTLGVRGRRDIRFSDHHFLSNLYRVQVDRVKWSNEEILYSRSKLEPSLKPKIELMMERKKPLYGEARPVCKCKCPRAFKCKCKRKH